MSALVAGPGCQEGGLVTAQGAAKLIALSTDGRGGDRRVHQQHEGAAKLIRPVCPVWARRGGQTDPSPTSRAHEVPESGKTAMTIVRLAGYVGRGVAAFARLFAGGFRNVSPSISITCA
jgi:hypothetical protein